MWLSGVAAFLLYGWVLLLYWRWFVVPLGVRDISYWHCLGLVLFAYFLRLGELRVLYRDQNERLRHGKTVAWTEYLRYVLSSMAATVAVGWLLHLAMTR